jgi:hypothetical protein
VRPHVKGWGQTPSGSMRSAVPSTAE